MVPARATYVLSAMTANITAFQALHDGLPLALAGGERPELALTRVGYDG